MGDGSTTLVVLCIGVACLGLATCGGGGGGDGNGSGNGTNAGLGGWWLVEGRLSGTTEPFQPFLIVASAEQNGNLWANGTELVRTGDMLHADDPSPSDPDRTVIDLTVVSDDLLEGTLVEWKTGVAGPTQDLRLTRIAAPSGTFTVNGTVAGQPTSFSSSTAGARVENDVGEIDFAILHSEPFQSEVQLSVNLAASPIAPGTYAVGSNAGEINAQVRVREDEDDATAGTLTITTASGGRLAGSYDFTLVGGAVTGSFDVEVKIETTK